MEKEAVEWSRAALALLGARLADMRGESTKVTRDIFVTELTDAATAAEVLEKTAGQLVGMLNIAFKLLVELEEATDRAAEDWLGGLASWLTMIEDQESR
jgi:hypothetical protein